LVLGEDGTFWVSDEYGMCTPAQDMLDSPEPGPYIYQFTKRGKMVNAIRPPDALIPIRNGTERSANLHFASKVRKTLTF
jgi:hypothetical protein